MLNNDVEREGIRTPLHRCQANGEGRFLLSTYWRTPDPPPSPAFEVQWSLAVSLCHNSVAPLHLPWSSVIPPQVRYLLTRPSKNWKGLKGTGPLPGGGTRAGRW